MPHGRLCIHRTFLDSSSRGFPHSEIPGSTLIYSYPRLIAVSHVLHRLLMPRHSPYALLRLNFLTDHIFVVIWSKLFSFLLNCLSFVTNKTFKDHFGTLKRLFFSSYPECFPPFGEIVFTQIFGKTYLISFLKLRIKSVLIICSFYSSIYFIRFSMNVVCKTF